MKRFTLFCIIATLLPLLCGGGGSSLAAQSIHDQYATKAEACADASYRYCDEYYTYGQIGWEQKVGWRPIQYLDRYEAEHRAYNVNMTMFVQVMCGDDVLSDCEIVAVNAAGRVVGNQCPEPFPDGYGRRHECTNVASMAVFGDVGDKIRFKIVTGSTLATLREDWADEDCTFGINTVVGLADTNGDGRPDTLEPFVLHVSPSGDVNRDGRHTIVDVAGLIAILNAHSQGVPTPPAFDESAADYDGSGAVTLDDVDAMVNAILHVGQR